MNINGVLVPLEKRCVCASEINSKLFIRFSFHSQCKTDFFLFCVTEFFQQQQQQQRQKR